MKSHTIITSVRAAFENIKIKPTAFSKEGARIGGAVHDALSTKNGIINRPDWNANLSFKTAKLLNAPAFDVNNHKGARNAYDKMCQG